MVCFVLPTELQIPKSSAQAGVHCGFASVKRSSRNFPDGLVLKDPPRNEGTWVQSLTRELRSHMPQSKEACIPGNERSLVLQRSPNTAK